MPDKTTVALPELPKPDAIGVWGYMEPTTYSAEAMRAYATAALAQKDGEIERLREALRYARDWARGDKWRYDPDHSKDWQEYVDTLDAALGSQA